MHDPFPCCLSEAKPETRFTCGDFKAHYRISEKTSQVELRLYPTAKEPALVAPRAQVRSLEIDALPAVVGPVPSRRGVASLIQLKLAEDNMTGGFAGGRTMQANLSVAALRFSKQECVPFGQGGFEVRTELTGPHGCRGTHVLRHEPGDDAVSIHTEITNAGDASLTLELLSSFCLGEISPFDSADAIERLRLHRFRSLWSSEGRHDATDFEDLHLERSWLSIAVVNERFGQVGSMPVRGWFPFAAIEDKNAGVFWAAQLAVPGSWQFDVFRIDDKVSLSGGLADREFGHWLKRLAPGERLVSPSALVTVATGDIDSISQRLTRMHTKPLAARPGLDDSLPILFNEWCSSWGSPTPEFIHRTAARLKETPTRVFVIDDGWAEKETAGCQCNGDWNVDRRRFPDGLKAVTDDLAALGFAAGLWFEFEVCTEGTKAFQLDAHKLRRDGRTLQVGSRHFWDFTDPWTFAYLSEKVIARLRDDGFRYMKVDYNDTIGLGSENPESLGEGLRLHLEGVQRFFRKLRVELPDLLIEICASGGHRLEPSFLALGAMGSFSDAHECPEIPIIAANLHRLIHPRQNQIWAVLHASDTLQRLHYSLSATFLGRVCLSGEITTLDERQFALVREDLEFYEEVKHLLKDGESRIHRELSKSWREPRGWQVVTRVGRGAAANEMLVVVHAFGACVGKTIPLPFSGAEWTLKKEKGAGSSLRIEGAAYRIEVDADFSAHLLHLTR